jgi:hypothetical protein
MAKQRDTTERREKKEEAAREKEAVLKNPEALRGHFYNEFQEMQSVQQRLAYLRERQVHLFSRLSMMGNLLTIQQSLGGEFPPRVAFVHMADYVLNIRRIGRLDVDTCTVALEVYEHHDIAPGILWLPLDQIWWVGTTDLPYGDQHVSLANKEGGPTPPPTDYATIRRKIAGLDSRRGGG